VDSAREDAAVDVLSAVQQLRGEIGAVSAAVAGLQVGLDQSPPSIEAVWYIPRIFHRVISHIIILILFNAY
jgi:hypothetical protein